MRYLILCIMVLSSLVSCQNKQQNRDEQKDGKHTNNPPAPGFDETGSDHKAIQIANDVMEAMGGRENWDKTRFLSWNFFGARTLWWDKLKGDVRIQMHNSDSTIILINIFNDSGKVFIYGNEESQPDSVAKYLIRGKGIWINDAYWLFMPFKLKDSGVTLTHMGEDTTQSGKMSDVLQLTFKNVGNTPQNKYHVWVDQSDHLIKQWAFFREYDMSEPNFITPWEAYDNYGYILLAGNRGERNITEIIVSHHMEESLFHEF